MSQSLTPEQIDQLMAAGWRLMPPAPSDAMVAAAWKAARDHGKATDKIYQAVVDTAQTEIAAALQK